MFPYPRPLSICEHLSKVNSQPDAGGDIHRPGRAHLSPGQAVFLWYTGCGMEAHWVCKSCADGYPQLPALVPATDEGLTEFLKRSPRGLVGEPGFPERDAGLRMSSERLPFPFKESLVSPWLDLQPDLTVPGQWFLLLRSGEIAVFHPREQRFQILFRLDPGFIPDEETALHVDASSSYGAVCECKGSLACVFKMRTGAITKQIDRGNYYPEHCRFSLAFFTAPSGLPLLIAATAWNVLDIFDPSDGSILTSRSFSERGAKDGRETLDYFHANLCVSHKGEWIADTGWMWHPVGEVRTWNLAAWLSNAWESEYGESVQTTALREYFWDSPLCWIDDHTLAIWGWGDDDELMIPAVCLFDAATGKDLAFFPGPKAGHKPCLAEQKHRPQGLFFDEYLFSADDEHGLAVWDIADGARLLHEPTLKPLHYHPGSKELISISGETVTLSRLVK